MRRVVEEVRGGSGGGGGRGVGGDGGGEHPPVGEGVFGQVQVGEVRTAAPQESPEQLGERKREREWKRGREGVRNTEREGVRKRGDGEGGSERESGEGEV